MDSSFQENKKAEETDTQHLIEHALDTIKSKKPYKSDLTDVIFAVAAFVLGYLFSRWVLFTWQGWGVTAFTSLYLGSATLYFIKKGNKFNPAAWFWLAVTFMTGLSYALWDSYELGPFKALFLFCSAAYWVLCATSTLISGKTGNRLLFDGLNAVIIIPFRNIGTQYRSFGYFGGDGKGKFKKALPVVLGLLLAVIILAIIIPQLMEADSGGFTKVIDTISRFISIKNQAVITFLIYLIPTIPVSAYMFGLILGGASKRGTDIFKADSLDKTALAAHVFPQSTVYVVLCTVSLIYMLFISCQLPYFFSAFTGKRPEGWLIYSEYARRGFFELCRIAFLNLAILTAANLMCKKQRSESRTLKIFNIIIALLTLLIITTAFSKMVLYINTYGLTMRRLMPCVFMVFIAIACVGVIAIQKWNFSIVRVTLASASVIFCLFCLIGPDGLIVRYNTERYIAGSLSDYDTEMLYRAGNAGVIPALEVYDKTPDTTQKSEIREYLDDQYNSIIGISELNRYSVQSNAAMEALEENGFSKQHFLYE